MIHPEGCLAVWGCEGSHGQKELGEVVGVKRGRLGGGKDGEERRSHLVMLSMAEGSAHNLDIEQCGCCSRRLSACCLALVIFHHTP